MISYEKALEDIASTYFGAYKSFQDEDAYYSNHMHSHGFMRGIEVALGSAYEKHVSDVKDDLEKAAKKYKREKVLIYE